MKKPLKLKELSINDIRDLVSLIKNKLKSPRNSRGRPKIYSDELILIFLIYKTAHQLSFRELRFYMKEIVGYSPAISTLHYRFSKIPQSMIEELFKRVIAELLRGKEVELFIPDGTGFGYDGLYRLSWRRGKEMREVSSHVKTEVVVVRDKTGMDIVYSISTGPPYSDERRLVEPLLKGADIKAEAVIADGMSVKILEMFKRIGAKVIVPIREGMWTRVRNSLRLEVMNLYRREKGVYKRRYIVEQVIGKVKNAYGRCEGAKRLELAVKYVWIKFIAYNYCVLRSMRDFWRLWVRIFRVISAITNPLLAQ